MSSLKVLLNTINYLSVENSELQNFSIMLNVRLFEKHPSLFDYQEYMISPCMNINGKIYQAKSRLLRNRHGIDTDTFDSSVNFDSNVVIDELYDHIQELKKSGLTYVPYIPLIAFKAALEGTLEATVAFKTRYAILEKPDVV